MILNKDTKIYIAGHRGLVGSAIWNNLKEKGYNNLIGRNHSELDLTNQLQVRSFFDTERPEAVVLAAAHVGGIMANSLYRADFIMQNMQIQCNVISEAFTHNVKKLLFLGSTCIYPKNAKQPIKEDELLTAPLEYTNEEYALAKISGLKMCESYNLQYGTNYIAVMPTNLYGPNDNFHLENSHVMPAMMRKIYLSKLIYENDWNCIRKDLNKRPVEKINGNATPTDILNILSKYGIYDNKVELWGAGAPPRPRPPPAPWRQGLRRRLGGEGCSGAEGQRAVHTRERQRWRTTDGCAQACSWTAPRAGSCRRVGPLQRRRRSPPAEWTHRRSGRSRYQ